MRIVFIYHRRFLSKRVNLELLMRIVVNVSFVLVFTTFIFTQEVVPCAQRF